MFACKHLEASHQYCYLDEVVIMQFVLQRALMQLEGEANNITASVPFNFRNDIAALAIC